MNTRLITTKEELIALKDLWNQLVRSNPETDVPFFSWEWFYHSLGYANSPKLFIVLALKGDQVVGILPLVATNKKRRGIVLRTLEFCPNGNTPRNAIYLFVAEEDNQREVIDCIFDRLNKEKKHWDMLCLSYIEESSLLHRVLSEQKPTFPFSQIVCEPDRHSPFLALDEFDNFDDYLQKNISTRRRTKIRRDIKRLDSLQKPWSLRHYDSFDQYKEATELLLEVRGHSWKGTASASFQQFFRDIAKDFYFDKQIYIAILMLEEEPIAAQFFLCRNGTYHLCLNDHNESYHETLIPGSNLSTLVLMYAFEQHWKLYDFSGDAYEYKTRLGTGVKPHSAFQVFHSGLKSSLVFLGKTKILPLIRSFFSKKSQKESPQSVSEKD